MVTILTTLFFCPRYKLQFTLWADRAMNNLEQLAKLIVQRMEQNAVKKLAYTIEEDASAIGCSKLHVYDLVRQKELTPVLSLGKRGIRISVSTLERLWKMVGLIKFVRRG